MKKNMGARIFIIDAAPGKAWKIELSKLAKQGFSITFNTNGIKDKTQIQHINNNVSYVDFNIWDQKALYRHITEKNLGYRVIKSRLNVPFNREFIQMACSSSLKYPLKIIAQAGVSINHIDCKAATEHGVIVTNTPGSNSNAVAEFVIGQMLALARNILAHNKQSHHGKWSKDSLGLNYLELKGKTLGLIGIGNIARQLIPKAKAFGMDILALGSQSFTEADAKKLGVKKVTELPELLKHSNFVSLHVPLTDNTKHFIGINELQLMKKNSFLINTSRGEIVDENALANELQREDRNIIGAAIDTFEYEKLAFRSPLIGIEHVLLTPHIAGSTPEALENAASMISENITAILNGDFNIPIINRPVLDKFILTQETSLTPPRKI